MDDAVRAYFNIYGCDVVEENYVHLENSSRKAVLREEFVPLSPEKIPHVMKGVDKLVSSMLASRARAEQIKSNPLNLLPGRRRRAKAELVAIQAANKKKMKLANNAAEAGRRTAKHHDDRMTALRSLNKALRGRDEGANNIRRFRKEELEYILNELMDEGYKEPPSARLMQRMLDLERKVQTADEMQSKKELTAKQKQGFAITGKKSGKRMRRMLDVMRKHSPENAQAREQLNRSTIRVTPVRTSLKAVKEDFEVYDVLEILVNEGYANDIDSAAAIFEAMSDAWLDDLLEIYGSRKDLSKLPTKLDGKQRPLFNYTDFRSPEEQKELEARREKRDKKRLDFEER
jgi:hypothetical protein